MTERELLAAISASPDDDEPRLAYAKFIATDDPAYSEFIRLQIDRARDEPARMAPRGTPSQREIDLRRSNGPDWARYLTKLVRRSPVNPSDSMDQGYELIRGSGRDRRLRVLVSERSNNGSARRDRACPYRSRESRQKFFRLCTAAVRRWPASTPEIATQDRHTFSSLRRTLS